MGKWVPDKDEAHRRRVSALLKEQAAAKAAAEKLAAEQARRTNPKSRADKSAKRR